MNTDQVNADFLRPFETNKGQLESTPGLVELANKTVLKCYCEHYHKQTALQIQECENCGHTTCVDCGRTPKHVYKPINIVREEPKVFDAVLRDMLPMRLQLSDVNAKHLKSLEAAHTILRKTDDWKLYRKAVTPCLGEEVRFKSTAVSDRWKIEYEGANSRLVLVLLNRKVQWQFYAKVDPNENNGSRIRALLDKPFARMSPVNNDNLWQGDWEFCLPFTKRATIKIEGEGDLMSSYQQNLEMWRLRPREKQVYPKLRISVVEPHHPDVFDQLEGTYHAAQDCGMAMNSLHKKAEPKLKGKPDLFLFLNPTGTGVPHDDRFAFSTDKHRLRFGEVRHVVAELHQDFRLSDKKLFEEKVTQQKCEAYGEWHRCPGFLTSLDDVDRPTYEVIEEKPRVHISAGTEDKDFPLEDKDLPSCTKELVALLHCKFKLQDADQDRWSKFEEEKMDKAALHQLS